VRIIRNYTVVQLPSYKCCLLKGSRLLVTTWVPVPSYNTSVILYCQRTLRTLIYISNAQVTMSPS